jgi:aminoglycoside N3'-acetyltransferase
MHPTEDLANGFRKLGVRPADTVMLHALPRCRFVLGSELPLLQRLIVELLLKRSNNCAIFN